MLVYSASGAGLSGTLGGQAFNDASWRLTATADETLATLSSFTVPPLGSFDLWWLPASPRVSIEIPGSVLEADLLPSPSLQWLVLSGRFPVGPDPKIGFVFTTPTTFSPETAAGVVNVPGSFVDLQSPVAFAGASIFEANSYPSTSGDLVISSSAFVPGTFRIDPVPGPLPVLAVAGAFSWSRRLRRRALEQTCATRPGLTCTLPLTPDS
jgi:hypothetical protein